MSSKRAPTLPQIKDGQSFATLVQKLASYVVRNVDRPYSYDDLRKSRQQLLTPLVHHLYLNVKHSGVIAALMSLRGHFAVTEDEDDEDVNVGRAAACEIVAMRYINRLSEREKVDCLLFELPEKSSSQDENLDPETVAQSIEQPVNERTPLMNRGTWRSLDRPALNGIDRTESSDWMDEPYETLDAALEGLNALEIAAVSGAKKFLSQRTVQRIVTAIWDGEIVFWSSLQSTASKQVQFYRKSTADPYSRLRVPKYLKAFEVLFFLGFLAIYYVVLVQRVFDRVTPAEVLLYIWLASFAHNELGEFWDAGTAFYLSDFWALWDLSIVAIGVAFFSCRMIGFVNGDRVLIDTSFDILSTEALVLIPRICSLLSLHPYFGTLLPCLREMTKDFIKFLSLIVILYMGFLTTFSLLARGHFTFNQMSWILIKVFFGSSYLGFDTATEISPILGPPLMFIFVCLTNILLITSLISILSNSLTQIIEHAKDEYLFVYSIFVLEASTSNRLTYFLPPLNLIPLALRPLRLFLSTESLRSVRIILLKSTHFPHVCAIRLYEYLRGWLDGRRKARLPLAISKHSRQRGSKRYSRNHRLSTPLPGSLKRDISQPYIRGTTGADEDPPANSPTEIRQLIDDLNTQIRSLTHVLDSLGVVPAD